MHHGQCRISGLIKDLNYIWKHCLISKYCSNLNTLLEGISSVGLGRNLQMVGFVFAMLEIFLCDLLVNEDYRNKPCKSCQEINVQCASAACHETPLGPLSATVYGYSWQRREGSHPDQTHGQITQHSHKPGETRGRAHASHSSNSVKPALPDQLFSSIVTSHAGVSGSMIANHV